MVLLDITKNALDINTIIVSIIGSGAFSYVVTLLTSRQVKKSEFAWNYRNYILDKRKFAYEEIMIVIIKYFEFGEYGGVKVSKFLHPTRYNDQYRTEGSYGICIGTDINY